MLLFTTIIALWNKLLLWDDDQAEEGIAEYVKQRGYIAVLPPNKDHQVHYIRAATATRDILEWAGGADWPDVWKDLKSGQITLAEALLHAPKAAVNKVVQGTGPGKSALEIAFGKSLFPDLFEPQPQRSVDTRNRGLDPQNALQWFLSPISTYRDLIVNGWRSRICGRRCPRTDLALTGLGYWA